MSVTSILNSNFADGASQSMQNRLQFPLKLQQLNQDLKSGNLAAAKSDFAALQQFEPVSMSTSSTNSTNPLVQEINQLAKDLQSGDLTAAQKDVTTIQQSQQFPTPTGHHHHRVSAPSLFLNQPNEVPGADSTTSATSGISITV
jgi:hypothetical protein